MPLSGVCDGASLCHTARHASAMCRGPAANTYAPRMEALVQTRPPKGAQPAGWPARERVAIAGSCMTRDNFNSLFNPAHRDHYEVVLHGNQSSVIALMSPPIAAAPRPRRDMTATELEDVRSDLSRDFLPRIAAEQPDLLLVDFQADVRFGVARLPDGRFLTDNRWRVRRTDFDTHAVAAGGLTPVHPKDDPERYFALWSEAMDRFAAHLRRSCPRTRVVVHRGWNATRIAVPGRPRPVPLHRRARFAEADVPWMNAWWARLDDHAVAAYGWEQIDLRDLDAPTYAGHPWGAYFGHYTPDYYHRFLAELTKLTLRRQLDPATTARLELVERAAEEPWRRRLEEEQAVARRRGRQLRATRRRLRELETQGVRAAVRRAVSRRLGGATG